MFANASEELRRIPTETYEEILSQYNPIGIDPMTGKKVNLRGKALEVKGLSTLIVKLTK